MKEPIANPADTGEELGHNWRDEDRRVAIKQASELLEQLNSTIRQCYLPDVAIDQMRAVFGDRIPDDPDLVAVQDVAAAEVRSHEKLYAPAPIVGRSISG